MSNKMQRFAANGAATFLSAVLLLSMAAAPTLAFVTANSVGSAEIKDRSIKAVDVATGAIVSWKIADGAVNSAKVRDYSLTKRDLASSSVNSYKIADNSIKNRDIAPDAAISDSKIKYLNKTRRLSVHAGAFRPEDSTTVFDHNNGFFLSVGGSGTAKYFIAPVYLPEGARITKLTAFTFDDSASYNVTLSLSRNWTAGTGSNMNTIASANSSGNDFNWRQFAGAANPSYREVDNDLYSYILYLALNAQAPANMRFNRAVIEYEVDAPD